MPSTIDTVIDAADHRGITARLLGPHLDAHGVTWRSVELPVIGQQRQGESLRKRHVEGVVGGEVFPQTQDPGQVRRHGVTLDRQVGEVLQHLFGALDADPDAGLGGQHETSDRRRHLSVDEGGRVDQTMLAEPLAKGAVPLAVLEEADDDRGVDDPHLSADRRR